MPNLSELTPRQDHAQALLQAAYAIDVGLPTDETAESVWETIAGLGYEQFKEIHKVYYDGGLFAIEDIRENIVENPNGVFVSILRRLIQVRHENGDYPVEVLFRIYGVSQLHCRD